MPAHFHDPDRYFEIAETLRNIARRIRFDDCRVSQLSALADGFRAPRQTGAARADGRCRRLRRAATDSSGGQLSGSRNSIGQHRSPPLNTIGLLPNPAYR